MKIKLKPNHIAVLSEENGGIVGCFTSNNDAKSSMEQAVSEHFDCVCSLSDNRDFEQPLDYEHPYTFCLYLSEDARDEYVTLTMTYASIY
jgi:hypothetical protein